jgi:energy-coupling factor transporter ATP-binding protein EcfA2
MNPYRPGTPIDPASFAGRTAILQAVDEHVDRMLSARVGHAVLFYGYRGSGKTSVLRKVEALVEKRSPNTVVVEVPLRAPHSPEGVLLSEIVGEIDRRVANRPVLRRRVRRAIASVQSVTVSAMGSGIELVRQAKTIPASPLSAWRQSLQGLSSEPGICICIDDADLLDQSGLGTLKTIAETDEDVPIFLAVAGGVELFERLSGREASPIARAFSGATYDVGEFAVDETRQALEGPLTQRRLKVSWTPQGISTVHRLSHGNPYLVQCLAHAAYQASGMIDGPDVDAALSTALRTASAWLDREYAQLSDEDIRSFAKIAEAGVTTIRAAEMTRLGVPPLYIRRLTKAGVLRRLARGHYELRRAPVIAYYHALKRGLAI